jgi:hypothetical protein
VLPRTYLDSISTSPFISGGVNSIKEMVLVNKSKAQNGVRLLNNQTYKNKS